MAGGKDYPPADFPFKESKKQSNEKDHIHFPNDIYGSY
jgi:hypothetical protein